MCYPPLTWQTYDVEFTAPKYKDGKKVANARVEVRHNGVVIHPEFELPHATPGRQAEGPAPRPFYLQGHGNKVEYRNIWVKEKNAGLTGCVRHGDTGEREGNYHGCVPRSGTNSSNLLNLYLPKSRSAGEDVASARSTSGYGERVESGSSRRTSWRRLRVEAARYRSGDIRRWRRNTNTASVVSSSWRFKAGSAACEAIELPQRVHEAAPTAPCPLEEMDWHVSPQEKKLLPNPESPDKPSACRLL